MLRTVSVFSAVLSMLMTVLFIWLKPDNSVSDNDGPLEEHVATVRFCPLFCRKDILNRRYRFKDIRTTLEMKVSFFLFFFFGLTDIGSIGVGGRPSDYILKVESLSAMRRREHKGGAHFRPLQG